MTAPTWSGALVVGISRPDSANPLARSGPLRQACFCPHCLWFGEREPSIATPRCPLQIRTVIANHEVENRFVLCRGQFLRKPSIKSLYWRIWTRPRPVSVISAASLSTQGAFPVGGARPARLNIFRRQRGENFVGVFEKYPGGFPSGFGACLQPQQRFAIQREKVRGSTACRPYLGRVVGAVTMRCPHFPHQRRSRLAAIARSAELEATILAGRTY